MTARSAAVLTLLVGALTACAVGRYDVAYEDVFAARAEDAVDRGWVPQWLPEGSTDIRSSFDPDDGASILVATLGEDTASLDEACQPTDGLVLEPALSADWFPGDVIDDGDVLACTDDRLAVVVDGVVVAWTPQGVTPVEPE